MKDRNGTLLGIPNAERLHDLAELERRPDLLLTGAVIHTEADIKWLDVCLEEIASLQPYMTESDKEHST